MPGGPSERCRRHHGDDGTRFGGVCRGPAQIRAFGLLVRRDAAAVGARPGAAGGHVRWPGGGGAAAGDLPGRLRPVACAAARFPAVTAEDRKSTRLNSSHVAISYAVFCLKKKKKKIIQHLIEKKKKKKKYKHNKQTIM